MTKKYHKSKHELKLLEILTQMDANHIRTLKDLQKEENASVYTTLWFAVEGFVNYVALQSKSHKTANGKYVDGNAGKIRELLELGAKLEDIRGSILLRIMEKMDRVLNRPVSAQVPYCFTICSNCLVNEYRKLCPDGKQALSLNQPLSEEDENYTMEDTVADADTTEDWVMAREAVRERAEAKQQNKSQEILRNITHLHDGAAVFTYLCFYEKMRPRHTTELLLIAGSQEKAAELMKNRVCRKYALERKAVSALLDKPFINTLKLETGDKKKISAEISRVKNRMPMHVKMSLK